MMHSFCKCFALLLLLAWTSSLFFPVASLASQSGSYELLGFNILLTGWMGPVVGQFGWFANLAFPFALVLMIDRSDVSGKALMGSSSIMLIGALNAVFWTHLNSGPGAGMGTITAFREGYFVWMAVMIIGGGWMFHLGMQRILKNSEIKGHVR